MTGNFAVSTAGHDKGTCYVIVGEENDFFYLCDGRLKTLEAPKKKRRKHVQRSNAAVEPGLRQRLLQRERVTEEEIRYEIKHYCARRDCAAETLYNNMEERYVKE